MKVVWIDNKSYELIPAKIGACCGSCSIKRLSEKCIQTTVEGLCKGGYLKETTQENKLSKKHKHADLIIAWANGAEIQFKRYADGMWEKSSDPVWDTDVEYRVKPEETYPKTTISEENLWFVYDATNGDIKESLVAVADEAIKHFITSGQMDEWIKGRNRMSRDVEYGGEIYTFVEGLPAGVCGKCVFDKEPDLCHKTDCIGGYFTKYGNKGKVLLNKSYEGFESLTDIERDVSEAINESDIPAEFTGTIKVLITYEEENEG